MRSPIFEGAEDRLYQYDVCDNPAVKGYPQFNPSAGAYYDKIVFCDKARRAETSCGRDGRYFERKDAGQGEGVDLAGARVTRVETSWVERLGFGEKPR